MEKMFLLVFTFMFIFSNLTGWIKTYGGNSYNVGYSISQTNDSGFIISGATGIREEGGRDVYLIKIDNKGDTLWTRSFGGSNDDIGESVQQTRDGGYIIAGTTESFGAGGKDVYLIKTNSSGDTIWTRTYGGACSDYGMSVQETTDEGYIIAGCTYSYGVYGDVYLIKTNRNGNIIWTRNYDGDNRLDFGYSVKQTRDGGYVIVGRTNLNEGGGSNVYIIKTSGNGDTIWTRNYGGGHFKTYYVGKSVQETTDGGYIIAGENYYGVGFFGNGYLIKIDSNGDSVWAGDYMEDCEGESVLQTTDGGYVIAGYTYGGAWLDKVCLIKTDSNGEILWKMFYEGKSDTFSIRNYNWEYYYSTGYSVQQTTDGGYVIVGNIVCSESKYNKVYLVKTDENGVTPPSLSICISNFKYRLLEILRAYVQKLT